MLKCIDHLGLYRLVVLKELRKLTKLFGLNWMMNGCTGCV